MARGDAKAPSLPRLLRDRTVTHALRQTMIDSQLRTVGIIDAEVIRGFASVAREAFVPARMAGLAYADAAIEVAPGRALLEPLVLGLLLERARIIASDRVLIIGAATGYSAAVAAQIAPATLALESDPEMAQAARAAGVSVVEGPLDQGWAAAAPYDVILFEGAIEWVPPCIAAQLAPGGRAAAVVRAAGVGSAFAGPVLADGRIGGLGFLEVAARELPGFARPRAFAF